MSSRISEPALNRVLLALSDPTRRALLERLSHGPARVTELAEPFAISLNSVSKHIRMLERASLVKRQVQGREHVLSIAPESLDAAAEWPEAQRAPWKWRLQALDDLLEDEDRVATRARKVRR